MAVLPGSLFGVWNSVRRLRIPSQLAWDVAAMVIFGAVVTGQLWINYQSQARQLWTDVVHDRNAHLEVGLGLANDIAHGRVFEVIRDVDKIKTWPPLHDGGMMATTMLLTGLDVRFAVVPSLVGFLMTAVFAYLLAQRLMIGPGALAGVTAAVLVLVSPAQRAFATDVMLESLGAGFTMAALYAAVRVVQTGGLANWRWLAIALSCLFFLKYNYWLLVVLALLGSWVLSLDWQVRWLWQGVLHWTSSCTRQLRHPLNWAIALLIGIGLTIKFIGGFDVALFGRTVPVRSPVGVATVAYWLLLVRLYPSVRQLLNDPRCDFRWQTVVKWHIVPAALWLAWPQKLASFLWVLNPGDNVGEFPATNRWEGFPFLVNALIKDYHFVRWSLLVVAGLVVCGMIAWARRQLRPGATAVVLLALMSIWLTATHPNRKSRFAHSWVPTLWVLAGAGVATLVRRSQPHWQPAATLAGLTLAVVHLPGLVASPHAPEGGVQLQRPSALTITDAYLPYLRNARRPAILSNVPIKFLARWTYMDRFGRGVRPITEIPKYNSSSQGPENYHAFDHWLNSSDWDAIVFVDFPLESPWYVPVPGSNGLEQLRTLCGEQQQMKLAARIESVPGVIVTVFTR